MRGCDPELYDALRDIVVRGQRVVAEIVARRILPNAAVFVDEVLTAGCNRDAWVTAALERTRGVDVVFLDPDNGLEVPSRPSTSPYAPKYTYYDEVRRFAERGQTLVVYQHLGRETDFVARRRTHLANALDISAQRIHALRYRRGTARVFFVIPAPQHEDALAESVSSFLRSSWQRHFQLA